MIEIRKKPILLAVKNGKPVERLIINGKEIIHPSYGGVRNYISSTTNTYQGDLLPTYLKPILTYEPAYSSAGGLLNYQTHWQGVEQRISYPYTSFDASIAGDLGYILNNLILQGPYLITYFELDFSLTWRNQGGSVGGWQANSGFLFWGNYFQVKVASNNIQTVTLSTWKYSDDGQSWISRGPWVETQFGSPDYPMFRGGIKYENGNWYKYLEIWGVEVWKNIFLFRERQVSSSNWYGGALPVASTNNNLLLPIVGNYIIYSSASYKINYKTGELKGANSAAGGSSASYGYYPNWAPVFYGYTYTQRDDAQLTDISNNRTKSDWNVLKFQQMPINMYKSEQFQIGIDSGTGGNCNTKLHLKVIDMGEGNN